LCRDLSIYPGGDLVERGLADLYRNVESDEALLVLAAAPRLRGLGLDVPDRPDMPFPVEHRLFESLEARNPQGAHMDYNALMGRIVSFASAYEHALRREPAGG
jgi:hypothetical protein